MNLAEAAVSYAQAGFRIFPLHSIVNGICTCRDGEKCNRAGKHPRTGNGLDAASADPAAASAWWRQWPDSNIGYCPEDVAILDLDRPEAVAELVAAGFGLPTTPVVRTGKGLQYHYSYPQPWPRCAPTASCRHRGTTRGRSIAGR
jgi:putative DNA primase/helicase